tara:strand:- start:209 stop:886 length:678 start_codon:yes stop_codon:yes gene_type:complete
MARKIFVSYKHKDYDVQPLPYPWNTNGTARDYVDYTEMLFDGEEIYKGERADEDLSRFKDTTIRSQLRDQIFDSSVTVVFISPNMVDLTKHEKDQFIPWELSYALQRRTRGNKTSDTNAVLAVVLPDSNGSYSHFLYERNCHGCKSTTIMTGDTFSIIGENMFNRKNHPSNTCNHCRTTTYRGSHSYIPYARWTDFVDDPDKHISKAQERKDILHEYDLTKHIPD